MRKAKPRFKEPPAKFGSDPINLAMERIANPIVLTQWEWKVLFEGLDCIGAFYHAETGIRYRRIKSTARRLMDQLDLDCRIAATRGVTPSPPRKKAGKDRK